ncbi:MAG: hypothetical protein HN353_13780 [Bdellovibrionales bacterium]|jgi:hypothetical protein|nr:hypothetical protein [Bdellovibrionales bacterium]MBT3524836.1 hypothetical protein [Bdellovibrionales bacterium]MBT7669212.1 hypothetical protein [Bdellovibrionales bacterium]MBT7768191.1 hypothetical protein [Bdellovibrionales bacterium]
MKSQIWKVTMGLMISIWSLVALNFVWAESVKKVDYQRDSYVRGVGNFLSHQDDSLAFIKKQLLNSAYKSAITQVLHSMGLDEKLFWQSYQQKFTEYFTPKEQALRQRYGLPIIEDPLEITTEPPTVENKLTVKQMEAFEKELRQLSFSSQITFGKLSRVVKAYTVLKMSRSTMVPNQRRIVIKSKISRKLLYNIYRNIIGQNEQSLRYDHIFVSTHFEFKQMTPNDMGVEASSEVTSVVREHWQQWLEDVFSDDSSSVVLSDLVLDKRLDAHRNLTDLLVNNFDQVQDESVTKSESDSSNDISEDSFITPQSISSSLWLKINIRVEKVGEMSLALSRKIAFDGDFLIIKLKNSELLGHGDIKRTIRSFSFKDTHTLSSNIASLIYRLPLQSLQKIHKKNIRVSRVAGQVGRFRFYVRGADSMEDLHRLKTLLERRGLTHQVGCSIVSIHQTQGEMSLRYSGTRDGIEQMLAQLSGVELSQGKSIAFQKSNNNYTITLLKKGESQPLVVPNGTSASVPL